LPIEFTVEEALPQAKVDPAIGDGDDFFARFGVEGEVRGMGCA